MKKVLLSALFGAMLVEGVLVLGTRLLPLDLQLIVEKWRAGKKHLEGDALRAEYEQAMPWGVLKHQAFRGQTRLGHRFGEGEGIIALGDSHVYGMEVAEPWPARLSAWNWGVPDYGTTKSVELYERFGGIVPHTAVVLQLCHNDLWDNVRPEVCPLTPAWLCPVGGAARRLGVLPWIGFLWLADFGSLHDAGGDVGVVERDLEKAEDLARRRGAKLVVMFQESWPRRAPGQLRRLKEFLKLRGVPVVELEPRFRDAGFEKTMLLEGHWSDLGHELAAKAVKEAL